MKYKQSVLEVCSVLVLLTVVLTACNISLLPNQSGSQIRSGNDWPMYMHDPERTGVNAETILSPTNVSQLTKQWLFQTQGVIAASAAVVGNSVYVGSWDGYEYALDAASGALYWKTFLGRTIANPYCSPPQAGVTSGAAVQNGTVYLGGGDAYWYALNAQTGAIEWKVYVGNNSAQSGYYNWSSPLLYNGYAYIGAGSLGDCPLAPGKLMQVDLSTHKVVHTFNIVPPKQIGGGIWSSPSVDTANNTLYVTTATENAITQNYAQAVLAVDASTLALKDYWKVPASEAIIDSDFGTTPILFQDKAGNQLVTAINKNGYAYTFKRNNLKAGPIWKQYIAVGGDCPLCGQGSISSGTFGDGKLYLAGEDTTINGSGYQGSVRALDPSTGKVLWQHGSTGPILSALTYTNGMIIDTAGNVLEVLSAVNGSRLASYTLDNQFYATPIVSHGQIIVGNTDGSIYAFGLGNRVSTNPALETNCLVSHFCMDVGNPATAGTQTSSNSIWNVTAGGAGMGNMVDQFHFIEQHMSGDTQISVRVTSLQAASDLAQAGLMVRQNSSRSSPDYTVFVTKDHALFVQYRLTPDSGVVSLAPKTTVAFPLYLQIQRSGDQFQASTSTDGTHYTLVPGSTVTLAMATTVMAGLTASAGKDGATSKATFSGVTISLPRTSPATMPSFSPCPDNWICEGVGNPQLVGDQTFAGKNWTIKGAGIDISSHSDQFHFIWQPIPHDGTISARILSQTAIDPWAKAGIMIRQSATADSPYYSVLATPNNGLLVQSRAYQGLSTATYTIPTANPLPMPLYLKIARSGNIFSTYMSNDGVTWTYVLGTSVEIHMNGPVLAGIAISSHNAQQLGSATLDSVNISTQTLLAPVACPDNWYCDDVGFAMLGGSQVYNNGTWTLQGGGADIGATADQFHGDWQYLSNDGSVSARVTSVSHSDAYAKAGVMLRQSTEPGSPYYAIFTTPNKGLIVQYRKAQGEVSVLNDFHIDNTLPIYLKVVRVGNTFSSYTSRDGVNWNILVSETVTFDMSTTLMAALAMTSHNSLQLGTATFDSVNIE